MSLPRSSTPCSMRPYPFAFLAVRVIIRNEPSVRLRIVKSTLKVINNIPSALVRDVHGNMRCLGLTRRIASVFNGDALPTIRQPA